MSKNDKSGCKTKGHSEKPSAKEMPVNITTNTTEKGQTFKRKAPESDSEPIKKRQKKLVLLKTLHELESKLEY